MNAEYNTSDPFSVRLTTFEEKMLSDLQVYFNERRAKIIARALFYLWVNRYHLETPEHTPQPRPQDAPR